MASPVIITDRAGRIEWVNRAFTRTTGYTAGQAVGQTPRLLRSGVMQASFYEDLWSTITAGDVWRGSVVNRRLDGSLYVTDMSITPVFRDREITHFIALCHDIRKHGYPAAGYAEDGTRFRDMFEQSIDSIMMLDADLRIVDVNPAAEQMFGWSREELLGRDATSLAESDGTRERFSGIMREHGVVRDFDLTTRNRAGSVIEIQLNAVPWWNDGGKLLGYQWIARDVTARKRFEEELQHLAFHDWLTGLPNLALFRDRLEHAIAQAQRTASRLALIYVDLDDFKRLNDSRGHNAGDRVLQQVARRFLACTRAEDTVARIGGDEFAIIAERLSGPAQLAQILERVTAAMRSPLHVDQKRMDVDASIGAAMHECTAGPGSPVSGTVESLIRMADAAMYQAKQQAGTRFHIFDPAVDRDGSTRVREQQELSYAIENDQLTTRYQPVIDLETGNLWGFEVLARWQHPERGMILPGQFIPLAEDSGLIGALGEWILERACRDLAGWTRAGLGLGVRLLVNLSPRQLEVRDLPGRLAALLDETGIDPTRIHLEVTEAVAVQHPGRLEALRSIGASVSVDDFGTGYSSLRYLRDLEVDSLKVDMGFVQGIDRDPKLAAIVRTIITLGAELGLDVIAEGIETESQLDMLRQMGCPLGQGFLFSRPVDAARFETELARHSAGATRDDPGKVAPTAPGE